MLLIPKKKIFFDMLSQGQIKAFLLYKKNIDILFLYEKKYF